MCLTYQRRLPHRVLQTNPTTLHHIRRRVHMLPHHVVRYHFETGRCRLLRSKPPDAGSLVPREELLRGTRRELLLLLGRKGVIYYLDNDGLFIRH